MVINSAPSVIKEVTVGAIHFGKKPQKQPLPFVAEACANTFGADWKERLAVQCE